MTDTPKQWRMVPVEMDAAMWRAAEAVELHDPNDHHETVIGNLWDAVLAASPAPDLEGLRERVARVILEAVFEGFEHGQCEKEWEPDYGQSIASDTTCRILSMLFTPTEGEGRE